MAIVRTEVETIEGMVRGLYEAISFVDPAEIDWARVRSHMAPGAQLIRVLPSGVERMTIDSWIESFRALIENGTLPTFWEGEVGRHVDRRGDIAHVFSSYEARPRLEDPRLLWRGVNSIQLYWRDGRWWVSSMLWTREMESAPIPSEYLPGSGRGGTPPG
jgi:hypothetical protein